jgi:hypothetical protein
MNGIVKVQIGKVEHTLLFGMKAIMIYSEKHLNELNRNPNKDAIIDEFKSFSYIVYAGLCNYAESQDLEYPTFENAYSLTEDLNDLPNEVLRIATAFKESRATQKLINVLNPVKKKVSKKEVPTL